MSSDSNQAFKKFARKVSQIHRAASRPSVSRGSAKRQDNVVYKTDNKLKGSYGETDLDNKVVKVNKRLHKKDGESLLDTIVHERMHLKHPKMHERTVRKLTPKKVKTLSKKARKNLYAKFR